VRFLHWRNTFTLKKTGQQTRPDWRIGGSMRQSFPNIFHECGSPAFCSTMKQTGRRANADATHRK
jgi:hypothetical protein